MMGRLSLLLLVVAWACAKPAPAMPPKEPDSHVIDTYRETSDRLVSRFLDRGMVVSLGKDGHRGDSLLWSGVALGALPCDLGSPLKVGLENLVASLHGGLARFADPAYDVSLDGAVGFYYGVATRLKRCPEERSDWQKVLGEHQFFMGEHHGAINDQGFILPPDFDFLQRAIFHELGLGDAAKDAELSTLNFEVTTWAIAVKAKKAACYRAHIGWLALRGAEALGFNVERNGFCSATGGLGLAVIDQWCGRTGLSDFLDGFQYNQWEYKHQRCPSWESPDGDDYETPAVDRLLALSMFYKL